MAATHLLIISQWRHQSVITAVLLFPLATLSALGSVDDRVTVLASPDYGSETYFGSDHIGFVVSVHPDTKSSKY